MALLDPITNAPKNQKIAMGVMACVESDSTEALKPLNYFLSDPYFSSTVFDKKAPVPQMKVPGLAEGAYYWTVQSVDADGKESVESEKNRFTVIAKGSDTAEIALELSPFVQHGHVIELKGRTERNARVMVNGAEVPGVHDDGTFYFFTQPLPNGENIITVTAQNAKGGVKTKQQKIVIQ